MDRVGQGPAPATAAPIGVVYNTSMTRPDAALALAALYVLANRREARVSAVCVAGAGLNTAIFCDIVNRFYVPGPPRSSNSNLPVGLAAASPLPPDSAMVSAPVNRTTEDGQPAYTRYIRVVSDTSQAEAVLRNGVILTVDSAVVLSAPATSLARSLELAGARAQYAQRVRRLVVVDTGEPARDPAALRSVVSGWPGPVFFCGKDVGEAMVFPAAAVDRAFGWAPMHPVADAYRGYRPMPYDTPLSDLAALYFAVKPDSSIFRVSEPGTLTVSDAGVAAFSAGQGPVRRVTVDPAQREAALNTFIDILSAQPAAPPAGRGRG